MGKHLENILGKEIPHKPASGLTGGKCISKHEPAYKEQYSCSHRWQAFEKALDNKALYELSDAQLQVLGRGRWHLLFRGGQKRVARLARRGEKVALASENKGMYRHEIQKPGKGDWDISRGKDNFRWDCNKPYYHEAHHVVPDATLRTCLLDVFKDNADLAVSVVIKVLEAPYSVHHKDNLIILPMDYLVGGVLGLPIHRETKQCQHSAYDRYVAKKLKNRLKIALEEIMKKHDEEKGEPNFGDLAQSIEAESNALYTKIKGARRDHGATSLDEVGASLFP